MHQTILNTCTTLVAGAPVGMFFSVIWRSFRVLHSRLLKLGWWIISFCIWTQFFAWNSFLQMLETIINTLTTLVAKMLDEEISARETCTRESRTRNNRVESRLSRSCHTLTLPKRTLTQTDRWIGLLAVSSQLSELLSWFIGLIFCSRHFPPSRSSTRCYPQKNPRKNLPHSSDHTRLSLTSLQRQPCLPRLLQILITPILPPASDLWMLAINNLESEFGC